MSLGEQGPDGPLAQQAARSLGITCGHRIHFHHRLSVAEESSFCQNLGGDTLDFLEESIRDETPEAYAARRRMTHVPFAIGEEFSFKWQFLPYIERGIANHAWVDICNDGVLTQAMKVIGWAEAHYIDLMPHNPLGPICTAATAHRAVAVPNFASREIRGSPTEQPVFHDERLFPVQHTRVAPLLITPDRPRPGSTLTRTPERTRSASQICVSNGPATCAIVTVRARTGKRVPVA